MKRLPASIAVVERGWLSCNSIVFNGSRERAVIDSGYGSEADVTLSLLEHALGGHAPDCLLNTHCHSDHIGGNRALQLKYGVRTAVPEGEAQLIERWDDEALLLSYADQHAERFIVDGTLCAGEQVTLGDMDWQIVAAPGHDPHAVMFFSPDEGILISGDALWENGFGVVFPALRGDLGAFALTRATLDRIGKLGVRVVIPGHGRVFEPVEAALERAYYRLEGYEQSLDRLARHAAKVMFTFSLLAKGAMPVAALPHYVASVRMLRDLNTLYLGLTNDAFAQWLVNELIRAGAARISEGMIKPRTMG